MWTATPLTEAGKAGEWEADSERKINMSIMDASGLRCQSDMPGEMSSVGSGSKGEGEEVAARWGCTGEAGALHRWKWNSYHGEHLPYVRL